MKRTQSQTFWLDQGEFLGGAERFSLDFLNQLNSTDTRRLSPVVIGAKNPDYKKLMPETISAQDFDFPSVAGGSLNKIVSVFTLFFSAGKLRKFVTTKNPQWVTNTPRGHFLLFLAKTFWRLPGPWVAIFHDFTTRPALLLRRIALKADVLIAISMPTRAYLRAALSADHYQKIRIIENGFALNQIPESAPPKTIQNIIHIGRIDPRKGQMYTAEVAQLLRDKNPALTFTIVGSSVEQDPRTTQYEREINDFHRQNSLPNLRFKAEVKDPFAEINQFDLLLVLSTEAETFGRIAAEGLACNKLVIAFNQTGPREILTGYHNWLIKQGIIAKNSSNPLLIEANNSQILAETIQYFAENPEMALPYATHSRDFITQNYNLQETKKRLVDVLSA